MAICCAYVPAAGMDVSPVDLRQRLTQVVPSYMLPSQWIAFTELPLNANGKVDRPRLREHFSSPPHGASGRSSPASRMGSVPGIGASWTST
jgi:acyl-CoA synthetase (AMP-forming)/AMP-acid ligase II